MKAEDLPPQSLADLVPRKAAIAKRQNDRVVSMHAEAAVEPMDPEESSRFDKLRVLRLQLARERQLPPYCICHDSTLKLIARSVPDDLRSLERIKGMGPHKVKMYGEVILKALGHAQMRVVPVEDEMPF